MRARVGFVLTLDAMLSLIIITLFVTGIIAVTENSSKVYSTYMRDQSRKIASSTLLALRTVPLNEIVDPSVIQSWIHNGILETDLVSPDMSPLDIVATYWATAPIYPNLNLSHKAEIILGYILNKTLTEYNYELLINNYTSPYLRKVGSSYSTASDVSPATLIMSGYAYNQTPRGYMARAYLTRATFERSDIFGIQRVLARCHYYSYYGWHSNTLRVETHFKLPYDAVIESADLNLVERTGAQTSYFKLNGYPLSAGYHFDVSGYLASGDNNLTAEFTTHYLPNYCYELGYGSGSMMYVKYITKSTNTSLFDPAKRYGELYDVQSYTGIYYLNALFVPGNITSISLHLVTEGVSDIRIYYAYGANYYELVHKTLSPTGVVTTDITAQDIEQGLANYGFTLENLSKTYFNLVIALDSWWDRSIRYFRYDTNYRLRRLYGNGQSYVTIDYIPRAITTKYSIPLSIFKDYDDIQYGGASVGNRYQRMSFSYYLPSNAEPWYVDIWTAIQFTTFTPTSYTTLSENGQVFYDYYSDIYMIRAAYSKLTDSMMVPGQMNTYVAESSDVDQYGFRYQESRALINYFIQAYAGYGNVFPKHIRDGCNGYNITYYWIGDNFPHNILAGDAPYCNLTADDLLNGRTIYAVDDAIIRLFNNLGGDGTQSNPILVELPSTIRIEVASMGDIPGLFKPIQITLRVWREG
ncbi:TPM domain-containing protein [Thermococcus sp.]|uniref:TPM domain-containing protein n=1 Tax=Thermococcus sp. TaxID=35749 RepID=UPI0026365124|nr:TPM domain-containing protein [Thermococcus sp.]